MYPSVNPTPAIMPAIAPSRLIRLEKIPIRIVGKNDEAAKPNANATVLATKSEGGLIPKYAAIARKANDAPRAHRTSCESLIPGLTIFFIKSCEIEVDRTNNNPAAVDSAAATQPAITNAMTHLGRPAISGLAITKMSFS